MNNKPILVTGGTGFAGSHLVRQLIADGHRVRVLTRRPERVPANLSPRAEVIGGDITDEDSVRKAVAGTDTIFHLAAAHQEPGIRDSRYREVHVDGTARLLEVAKSENVRRFVHCSTVGVLGNIETPPADETWQLNPEEIYQETKSEAETLALNFQKQHGLPVTVARPTAIYGPGDMRLLKLFRMIAKRRFVLLGKGAVQYHLIHIQDLVRGLRMLASHPEAVGHAFILAGREYCTLKVLTARIARHLGVPPPGLTLPVTPFLLAGTVAERVCIPLGINPPIYRRRVEFFTKSRAFSIEKARRRLGFEPLVELDDGLKNTIAWYQANQYLPTEGVTVCTDAAGSSTA